MFSKAWVLSSLVIISFLKKEAQILSVVDAYDAMTYERPYQRAFTREEALKEIKSKKGKQFSPKAVEAFLKAENKYHSQEWNCPIKSKISFLKESKKLH